jgi:hypothetical protein
MFWSCPKLHAARPSASDFFNHHAETPSHIPISASIPNPESCLRLIIPIKHIFASNSCPAPAPYPNHMALNLIWQMVLQYFKTPARRAAQCSAPQPTMPDAMFLQVFLQLLRIAALGIKWQKEWKVSIAVSSIFRFGTSWRRSGGRFGDGAMGHSHEAHMQLMLRDMSCEE